MLVPPAGDVAVQPVEKECERRHRGGSVEMRPGPALQIVHRQKYAAEAAGGIREGNEVREVEVADHREMPRLGFRLQGFQVQLSRTRPIAIVTAACVGSTTG